MRRRLPGELVRNSFDGGLGPVRSAGSQTAFAAGLHVEIELLDLGVVEQRLPGLHALLRAAFPDGLDEHVVRDESFGGDRTPQVWSEIGPERVDAVTAETIDMEPLPALVLVRGHEELVGWLRLGDLAAPVGAGRRGASAGLHGP